MKAPKEYTKKNNFKDKIRVPQPQGGVFYIVLSLIGSFGTQKARIERNGGLRPEGASRQAIYRDLSQTH